MYLTSRLFFVSSSIKVFALLLPVLFLCTVLRRQHSYWDLLTRAYRCLDFNLVP